MKSFYLVWIGFLVSLFFQDYSYAKSLYANMVSSGISSCFPSETKSKKGELLSCEVSAVVFDGRKLIFGNDQFFYKKPVSAVFSTQIKNLKLQEKPNQFFVQELIFETEKYEDFTITLDKKFVIATTGFDRFTNKEESASSNRLIYWPVGQEDKAVLLGGLEVESKDDSITPAVYFKASPYSDDVRKGILRVLGNPSYFKVEGVTVIPGNKILFAIREKGRNFSDFKYTNEIVSVSFEQVDNKIKLKDDYKLVYSFQHELSGKSQPFGISSIEWVPYLNRLLVLTSYEKEKPVPILGAYLWSLSLDELLENKPLTPVFNKKNQKQFEFQNKAEGMSVLSEKEHQIIFVHDNDKVSGYKCDKHEKKYHEFVYEILTVE